MNTKYAVFQQKRPIGDRAVIEFVGTVKVRPLECAIEAAKEAYPRVKYPLVENIEGYFNNSVTTLDRDEYTW